MPAAGAPSCRRRRLTPAALKQKLLLATGLALLVGPMLATTLWANQGDYRPCTLACPDKDAGEWWPSFRPGTPYRFDGAGNVLVPAGQYHELKKKLAQAGLPKGRQLGQRRLRPDGQDLHRPDPVLRARELPALAAKRASGHAVRQMVGVVDARVFADAAANLASSASRSGPAPAWC